MVLQAQLACYMQELQLVFSLHSMQQAAETAVIGIVCTSGLLSVAHHITVDLCLPNVMYGTNN